MLKNLINWQNSNGYKSKYIAEKLGISESSYSLIKSGKIKPSLDFANKLQKEFDIENVFELLIDSEED